MIGAAPHVTHTTCRVCAGGPLQKLIDFGMMPIADRLVDPVRPEADLSAPMTFGICPACGLTQLFETVDPAYLFHTDYPYYSSVSPALAAHFRQSAEALMARLSLDRSSFVVEAASNDGYMLRWFHDAGVRVLGIDPAPGPAQAAKDIGIDTHQTFFTEAYARQIVADAGTADLFLANNVLAHVADTNDFVAGIARMLAPHGVAVLEFPYLVDLIDNCAFDTIYHQHLLYLTLSSVGTLFQRHGLYLNDVERLAVHGGSLRVTIGRQDQRTDAVETLLAYEATRQIDKPVAFRPLIAKMEGLRAELQSVLEAYRSKDVKVAGYGAAAKATTFMHYLGITKSDLAVIADKNTLKHGRLMPGTHIPIASPAHINGSDVGAMLILAWNFANEIIKENAHFAAAGGEFIVPIPDLTITSSPDFRGAL